MFQSLADNWSFCRWHDMVGMIYFSEPKIFWMKYDIPVLVFDIFTWILLKNFFLFICFIQNDKRVRYFQCLRNVFYFRYI